MTDEEVIHDFMGWPYSQWVHRKITLDALWEVEERLTDEQWPPYRALIQESADPQDTRWSRVLLHAAAPQKIKALAVVIKGA